MAMACAGAACPIQLRALTDCTVLFLDYSPILEPAGALLPDQARTAANLLG